MVLPRRRHHLGRLRRLDRWDRRRREVQAVVMAVALVQTVEEGRSVWPAVPSVPSRSSPIRVSIRISISPCRLFPVVLVVPKGFGKTTGIGMIALVLSSLARGEFGCERHQ